MGPLLDQNTTTVEFLQLRKIAKYKPLVGPSSLACVEYNKTSIFTICTEKYYPRGSYVCIPREKKLPLGMTWKV